MNSRVRDIALQCGAWHQVYENVKGNNDRRFLINENFDFERFAELIVRECADIASINQYQPYSAGYYVKKHFGVEQ